MTSIVKLKLRVNPPMAITVIVSILLSVAPTVAVTFPEAKTKLTSEAVYASCSAHKPDMLDYCFRLSKEVDPVAPDVKSFHYVEQYDTSLYTFDPADSGPMGIFSDGGDPGGSAGTGTELVRLLPTSGHSPGPLLPDQP